jgi:hypothetical protein
MSAPYCWYDIDEMLTYPEEHPAACKTHLRDWVRLLRHLTICAFELREYYRFRVRAVLETNRSVSEITWVDDPGLCQVSQVRQL